jgi:hypothetical protein
MSLICPVCLNPAVVYADGRMGAHRNDIGEKCMMTGRKAPWDERSTREAHKNI